MATNIGLNVVEVDGVGSPALVGASTSVSAFNIVTRRGVPGTPIRVDSFARFQERFGGFFSDGLGAYLVKGFFDNGGQTAYVNRVVATDTTTGAKRALKILQDASPQNTLTLEAGFRGQGDPGAWGNDLFVKISVTKVPEARLAEAAAATTQGATITDAVNMTALPMLSVKVDGEADATEIKFLTSDFANPATATRAEIRDAINKRQTKVIASIATDKLQLTSAANVAKLRNDWTSLQVMAANTTLGFALQAAPLMGTPVTPAVGGATLGRIDDLHPGDAVRISDGATTALTKILSINPTTRAVTWAPAFAGIAGTTLLSLRVRRVEFDLALALGGIEAENVVETWTNLSMESDLPNYVRTVLNDTLRGSRLVTAIDNGSASPVGADVPAPTVGFQPFTGGKDGTPSANDFIGDVALRTGFQAFDATDIQLLACERSDPSIVTAALAYAASRGDCIYVGSVPEGAVEAGRALAYGQAFQGKNVYGALYGPWIVVADPNATGPTPLKRIPPTGHIMGTYARIETARGVWKAPAGDEANLRGAIDVEYRMSDGEHTDLVRNGSVNGVRVVPRAGIVIDASRTLSTDTRWQYVNVRLLFNYVKSSLKQGLRWVRQEPNRDTLWSSIKFSSLNPFLMGLWRQGAFGTGQPSEVFTVVCDASNNPPSEVDKGNLKVEVYFYPSKPAETIVVIVGQQPSGSKVSEA